MSPERPSYHETLLWMYRNRKLFSIKLNSVGNELIVVERAGRCAALDVERHHFTAMRILHVGKWEKAERSAFMDMFVDQTILEGAALLYDALRAHPDQTLTDIHGALASMFESAVLAAKRDDWPDVMRNVAEYLDVCYRKREGLAPRGNSPSVGQNSLQGRMTLHLD